MGDGYWNRQPPMQQQQHQQQQQQSSAGLLKRPRSDYDLQPSRVPPAHDMNNYLARDDDRSGPRNVKDINAIGSAYDRYLQSSQHPSVPSGEASIYSGVGSGRGASGSSMPSLPIRDPIPTSRSGPVGLEFAPNGREMGYRGQLPVDTRPRPREPLPLPPDASNTLYIEGLPSNCTRREVAHIFRPFVGYKEVRLVRKESKHRGGEPLILCFVDFMDAACAATALSALQGYKMDEHESDSVYLRLQFSKYPGPRSGSGSRGRR